jgi:hypothetical protein
MAQVRKYQPGGTAQKGVQGNTAAAQGATPTPSDKQEGDGNAAAKTETNKYQIDIATKQENKPEEKTYNGPYFEIDGKRYNWDDAFQKKFRD